MPHSVARDRYRVEADVGIGDVAKARRGAGELPRRQIDSLLGARLLDHASVTEDPDEAVELGVGAHLPHAHLSVHDLYSRQRRSSPAADKCVRVSRRAIREEAVETEDRRGDCHDDRSKDDEQKPSANAAPGPVGAHSSM